MLGVSNIRRDIDTSLSRLDTLGLNVYAIFMSRDLNKYLVDFYACGGSSDSTIKYYRGIPVLIIDNLYTDYIIGVK